MRVAVCTDRIGALASADAGAAIARAFVAAAPGVQVAVVPMGSGGDDLRGALAALGHDAAVVGEPGVRSPIASHDHAHAHDAVRPSGIDPDASTLALGRAAADALAAGPRRLVLDLTGVETHDGGAGLLSALGAEADRPLDAGVAALAGITRVDLSPVRDRLDGVELTAVVAPDQLGDMLLGLRGLTARRGHAVPGTDPALMLATDQALGEFAAALGVPDAPGHGAAGGAALACVALGATLTTGPALCSQVAGLERTASVADVLVTGADEVDFAHRGGWVVGEVAAVAERAMRPCVAVARTVAVSGRELRTFGVEVAHALGGGPELGSSELTQRASGVAASWTW